MWVYEYYLKNGRKKLFYTDSPRVPIEINKFWDVNENEIIGYFCDHFPVMVAEYFKNIDKSALDENIEIIIYG